MKKPQLGRLGLELIWIVRAQKNGQRVLSGEVSLECRPCGLGANTTYGGRPGLIACAQEEVWDSPVGEQLKHF